tara:strand:+ start:4542 stop:5399 length:858 start_codon:yes stop_codon:yes gene_type:complete
MEVIEVENISYTSDNKDIISDISFAVQENETFALLGANGAGKSTLIDIIIGDLKSTKGKVSFFGRKKVDYSIIGVSYDNFNLFPLLKVKELLKYFTVLYRLNYLTIRDKYFDTFGIEEIVETYVKKLSQGERKKLSILLSIIGEPSLLILDEPFANLDPTVIDSIWSVINVKNRTVFFSSHDWDLVEQISDKICFIKNGKLLTSPEAPSKIIEKLPSKKKVVFNKKDIIFNFLEVNKFSFYTHDQKIHVFIEENSELIENFLKQNGIDEYYSYEGSRLKDAYLYL